MLKQRQSLHTYVVREIGKHIVSGKWPHGRPIPGDAALCATLGVSRTALREALRVLATKGLVEARQKVGTVVRPREEWNSLDFDVLTWRVESDEADKVITELYELRQLIEPHAAALAASNATRRDLTWLQRAYDDMVLAGDDGEKVLDPDVRFHRGIIAATGNTLFVSLGLIVAAALEVNFVAIKDSPRGHAWALPLHKAILDAVLARDPKEARVAMQRLLSSSEKDMHTARSAQPRRRRSAHARSST